MINLITMKKILFTISAALLFANCFSQSVTKITMSESGNIEAFAFEPETNLMLNISPEGSIKNWGYDVFKERGAENFQEKLDKYQGNIEYYSDKDNEAFRGKLKYIGRTLLTYYTAEEAEEFTGRLKSVGTSFIEYYYPYENEAFRGRLKRVGNNTVTWYSSFENEASRGKLKSFGSTRITYYSSSSDKAYMGKVKSINSTAFSYYSSFDKTELRGRMSSSTQILYINGTKFLVKP